MKLTMRRALVATAGVVVAGGLVLGGTEAFASSPEPFTASNAAAANPAASPSASAKAGCKAAAKTAKTAKTKRPRACAGRQFAGRGRMGAQLLKRGVHGQETVKAANGSFTVREWQTGKVASINGSTVTVADASGTTWTWTVQSSTRYSVAGGQKGSLSSVHTGDTVFVRGVQNGSANDVTALAELTGAKQTQS